MDIIKKGIYYLIPGNVEKSLDHSNNSSNLAYYGVYLNVRDYRNLLYYTGGCCSILYIYDYKRFASVCFLSQLGIYLYCIKKWNHYL